MQKSVLCFLLVYLILVLGCKPSIEMTRFDHTVRAIKGNIDVFTSVESVKKPYKEIALITAEERWSSYSETELVDKIILKAQEIGADAIIIQPILHAKIFSEERRNYVVATAIVYDVVK